MTATPETIEQTIAAARAASVGKATSITAIDVSQRLVITDVFLVVSGSSERQVRALVDEIEEGMYKIGVKRLRREGLEGEAHWVLLDFGNLMVHVQQDEDREFYALERLWGDCPVIELPEDVTVEEGPRSSLADYFAPADDDLAARAARSADDAGDDEDDSDAEDGGAPAAADEA